MPDAFGDVREIGVMLSCTTRSTEFGLRVPKNAMEIEFMELYVDS